MTNRFRLTAVQIVTRDGGTYCVDPCGKLAVLVPVHDRWGELVDAVAYYPDEPGQWWLRFGDEVPVLGIQALADAAGELQSLARSGRHLKTGYCNAEMVPSCSISERLAEREAGR